MTSLGAQLIEKYKKNKNQPPPPSGRPNVEKEQFVKLVSQGGHTFYVHRECACVSKLIKNYLEGHLTASTQEVEFSERDPNTITFPRIEPHLLEKAIRYFYYKHRYDDHPDVRPQFPVEKDVALELINVARQLKC